VLRSGGPNHSKLLCVLEFIVHLPTGKTLKPPTHLRIRADAFRHPAGDFPLRQIPSRINSLIYIDFDELERIRVYSCTSERALIQQIGIIYTDQTDRY
jgi:hypothetical protein